MCRMRLRDRQGSGFTLIELLVVIAVIILLMAILLPVLQRAATQARQVQCLSNIKQLAAAIVSYSGNFRGFLPSPAHADTAVNIQAHDSFDGVKTAGGEYESRTWKEKIINYIGTSGGTTVESERDQYQLYRCPSVRVFKVQNVEHKSFYGTNAYISMHPDGAKVDSNNAMRMWHFEDMEQTASTFMIGENNKGHWAVSPEHLLAPYTFAGDSARDSQMYARHMAKASWVYGDGHTAGLNVPDSEARDRYLWLGDKP